MKAHPLRLYREANGLNLQSIADLLGIHKATVSKLETGNRRMTADMALSIERVTKGAVKCKIARGVMTLAFHAGSKKHSRSPAL
jgi:DNA-binding transcriptional regulator YdaS (Cro superfamily)